MQERDSIGGLLAQITNLLGSSNLLASLFNVCRELPEYPFDFSAAVELGSFVAQCVCRDVEDHQSVAMAGFCRIEEARRLHGYPPVQFERCANPGRAVCRLWAGDRLD